jgi:hypothetical protein
MPRLKYYNESTEEWEYVVVGGQGPIGPAGPGLATGGIEGQILVKVDEEDFNTQWVDNYAPDTRIIVKNDSGVTLTRGTPVMAVGAVGDRIRVDKAVADGSVEPQYLLGVMFDQVANGEEGYMTMTGEVKNVNTSSYQIGTILYIDPATPGTFTTTQPVSPNLSMPIAIVTRINASSGRIFVRMWSQQAGLHELHDVLLDSSIAENEILSINDSGLWINQTASELGLSEVGHDHDDLYYRKNETDDLLDEKSDTDHIHDDRYYTESETDTAIADAVSTAISTAISDLIDSSPETLDTLNEIAAAINDDANFATTVATQLAGKSDVGHTHPQSDIVDLASDLALKAPLASPTFTGTVTSSTINSGAITATGNVNPQATNTYDLGTSSLRWRNIYTQDLHLSNGIGDYTVIEGIDELYLVNNNSGKHFKFALIEVDPSEVPPKSES